MNGYYYLHVNGELIYKRNHEPADFRESDFVKMFWPIDLKDRSTAWDILVGAQMLGANKPRIDELASKWGCDFEDAQYYASYLGIIVKMDGDQVCAHMSNFVDLQESHTGFGSTAIVAIATLLTITGYRQQKLWGQTPKEFVTSFMSRDPKA